MLHFAVCANKLDLYLEICLTMDFYMNQTMFIPAIFCGLILLWSECSVGCEVLLLSLVLLLWLCGKWKMIHRRAYQFSYRQLGMKPVIGSEEEL